MNDYMQDVFYCFKISLKMAIIPIVIGIVITVGSLIFSGAHIDILNVVLNIRNTGIIFSCAGLFLCGAAFLKPLTALRPLNYENTWRKYLKKFGLFGAMLCTFVFLISYFLILDIAMYAFMIP